MEMIKRMREAIEKLNESQFKNYAPFTAADVLPLLDALEVADRALAEIEQSLGEIDSDAPIQVWESETNAGVARAEIERILNEKP